jgi:hypothetical protein
VIIETAVASSKSHPAGAPGSKYGNCVTKARCLKSRKANS